MLDPEPWSVFRVKAAERVDQMEKGYSRALFDCFNEIKGYRYLLDEGYAEVRFLPERPDAKTPDLRARADTATVLMEVKTINESMKRKDYYASPRKELLAFEVEFQISNGLKNKLMATIDDARQQLFSTPDSSVSRRIVYLVIRADYHVEADEDLAGFLAAHSTPDMEVLHTLLS